MVYPSCVCSASGALNTSTSSQQSSNCASSDYPSPTAGSNVYIIAPLVFSFHIFYFPFDINLNYTDN